jgi:hypothetical protein
MSLTHQSFEDPAESVPALFDAWICSFGLQEPLAPLLRTVSVWADYCSPPDASVQSMGVAHADLALWFFYVDDYSRDDYATFFDKCSLIS